MGGGGKGGTTTTQTMQIPPEVMARYNAVNARAETVAQTPYQKYSNDPNAFVAPLTQTQQAGIQNTNTMAGAAQPYYGAAAALTAAGAGSANPQGLNVGQYYNPYTQAVAAPTLEALQQQQATERSSLMNPQTARSFGGDRSGIVAANLARQQALGTAQAMNPIYKQAYDQALTTAGQQQGVGLAAQQANLQRLGQAGAQFGQLGSGAQAAGLAGAQAQLAAGSTEQQTGQASLQALYNQFQQQQAYPFQIAQFLSNIATGTGALSGNTTTGTTQGGGGFFSDERLKENVEQVGKTNDGQNIYRYNYKGDPRSQIGLIAQEVAQDHPEAVGQKDGYLTVDYRDATNDAVREHKADGGDIGTSAYDISAPSAMMGGSPVSPEVLAGLAAKPMVGLGGLPIAPGATSPGAAGILAPKATGLSPGSIEGAQAQLATLRGADMGKSQSGSDYFDQQKQQLQDFLSAHGASSQGGLVSAPGEYARGGYAGDGYVNPALQYYGPQGGKSGLGAGGPYGAQLTPAQVQAMKAAELMRPQQQRSGIETANQMASMALKGNEAWKARPDFLRSAADIAARDRQVQAAAARDTRDIAWADQYAKDNAGLAPLQGPGTEDVMGRPLQARGGLIHREHHAGLGPVGGSMPYGSVEEENALGGALTAPLQRHEMMQPGKMGQPASQPSGAQQLGQMAGQAKGLFDKGKNVYDFAAKKLSGEATGLAGQPVNVGSATATPLAEATTGAASAAAPATEGLAIAAAPAAELGAGLAGAAEAGAGLAGAAEAGAGLAGAAGAAEGAGMLGSLAAGAGAVGEGIMAALPFLAFLSDKRSKHDIESVGELNDGQPVYRFKYNGDDETRMGLMAQDVEQDHPEAVRGLGGVKMVDYHRATDDAARQRHSNGERVADTGEAPQGGDFLSKLASTFEDVGDTAVGLGKKAIDSVPTKDTFWVPAIAGLGSMLASPNKTLAGAIGSGLVGGATTYEAMQKQNALEAKQRLDTAKEMFKGPFAEGDQIYYTDLSGRRLTPQEYGPALRAYIEGKPQTAAAAPMAPPAAPPPPGGSAINTAKNIATTPSPTVERVAAPKPPVPSTVAQKPTPGEVAQAAAKPEKPIAPVAEEEGQPQVKDKAAIKDELLADPNRWSSTPAGRNPVTLRRIAERAEAETAKIDKTITTLSSIDPKSPQVASLIAQRAQHEANRKEYTDRSDKILDEAADLIYENQKAVSAGRTTGQVGREQLGDIKPFKAPGTLSQSQAETDPEVLGQRIAHYTEEFNRLRERGFDAKAKEAFDRAEQDRARLNSLVNIVQTTQAGTQFSHNPNGTPLQVTKPVPQPSDYRGGIDPNTGAVQRKPVTEFVGYPETGGHPVDPELIGKKVMLRNAEGDKRVVKSQEKSDKQEAEFSDAAEKSSSGIQSIMKFATAAKVLEAKGTNITRSELSNLARGLGFETLANQVMTAKDEVAAYNAVKTNVDQAIGQVTEAFSRPTQAEFLISERKATPSIDMPADSARSLSQTRLAALLWQGSLKSDWENEKRMNGTSNFAAWKDAWQKAHPRAMFEEAADRALGNFKGQALPPPNKFTEGVVYVMPKDVSKSQIGKMLSQQGYRPGDMFVMNGVNHENNDVGTPRKVSPTEAYKMHLQAPALTYGM